MQCACALISPFHLVYTLQLITLAMLTMNHVHRVLFSPKRCVWEATRYNHWNLHPYFFIFLQTRKNIPCHMSDVSCGAPCGKDLPCGVHKCQRVCHKDVCLVDGEVCQQPCVKQRTLCEHICAAPCHPNEPCPVTRCKAMVRHVCCICVYVYSCIPIP